MNQNRFCKTWLLMFQVQICLHYDKNFVKSVLSQHTKLKHDCFVFCSVLHMEVNNYCHLAPTNCSWFLYSDMESEEFWQIWTIVKLLNQCDTTQLKKYNFHCKAIQNVCYFCSYLNRSDCIQIQPHNHLVGKETLNLYSKNG